MRQHFLALRPAGYLSSLSYWVEILPKPAFGSIGGFEGCKRVFLVVKVQKSNLKVSLTFNERKVNR